MTITLQGFIKTIVAVLWFSSFTWLPLLMLSHGNEKGAWWLFGGGILSPWVVALTMAFFFRKKPGCYVNTNNPRLPKARVRQ